MKKGAILFLILFVVDSLYAQENKLKQTICMLNSVPLLIESEPVIYQWNKNSHFEMGPGRVRIRLAARQMSMEFDHLIQVHAPLPFPKQELLDLYLSSDTSFSNERKLPNIGFSLPIADTILKMNESFYLYWKDINGHVIQRIGFTTRFLLPTVIGYRVNQFYDSIDHSHKAKRIKYNKSIPIGYQQQKGNNISVDPGGKLELKLQTYPLLTDTVVQYRLTKRDDRQEGLWKMTGHVLALPELVEGNDYELELRYPNQQEQVTYHLSIRPYWYQIIWIQMVCLLLLIILVILATRFFYQRRLRKLTEQRKRLEEQLTTIQSQLNPHFIFNALSSIEGLIMDGEREEANHYLSIFSSIMREALRNSDKMLISLQEEIELMEKYMQIEQLRFGFQYTIQISEDIHLAEIEIPPMLLQPVIENAVKHGAASLGEDGWITLTVSLSGESMSIRIVNNASLERKGHSTAGGHGLVFTQQRIRHLKVLFPLTPIDFSLDVASGRAEAIFEFHDWMA